MGEELLTKRELAKLLKVSLPTINRWVKRGGGPPHLKVGVLVRYRLGDVGVWLESLQVKSRSAA
jgi:excisionase family DNA binding protein